LRTKNCEEFLAKIKVTPIGQSVGDYSEAFHRCDPDKPSPTVKANNGSVFVHYAEDRLMTPRELARLQGFPDSHKFCGNKRDVLIQIGNAVPIQLAHAFAEVIKISLRGASAAEKPVAESNCRKTATNDLATPPTQSDSTTSPLVFSKTGKMPGPSWSTPATSCLLGSKLQDVPGSVCANCYAMRGNYLFPVVTARRQENLRQMREPGWVERMVTKIVEDEVKWFRWFDSGDLLDEQMLENIVAIAIRCPSCRFWLPTRELGIISGYVLKHRQGLPPEAIWPTNLTVRCSANMIDGSAPTAFAQRHGCLVSRVTAGANYTCHAPSNGGKCGSCRKCWERDDFEIVYHFLTSGRFQPATVDTSSPGPHGHAVNAKMKSLLLHGPTSDRSWKNNLKRANTATLMATLNELSGSGRIDARKRMHGRLSARPKPAATV
jgi:hypothetical protein